MNENEIAREIVDAAYKAHAKAQRRKVKKEIAVELLRLFDGFN